MTAIALGVLLCVVLFILGLVAPRLSRKAEHGVDKTAGRAEGHENPHSLPGRAARQTTGTVDTAADKAAEAGRALRGRK